MRRSREEIERIRQQCVDGRMRIELAEQEHERLKGKMLAVQEEAAQAWEKVLETRSTYSVDAIAKMHKMDGGYIRRVIRGEVRRECAGPLLESTQ